MRFSKGQEVEVRGDSDGVQGVWYEARVTRTMRKTRRYSVVYDHLLDDGGSTSEDPHPLPIREIAECKRVRPRPPRRGGPFALHQPVDAWHKDGWWTGVVLERGDKGEHYTVCFPGRREQAEFPAGDLRVHLEWVEDEWLQPDENAPGQGVLAFPIGTQVEVAHKTGDLLLSWVIGTVEKLIWENNLLVRYESLLASAAGEFVREIVGMRYVRPCPPLVSCGRKFHLLEDVEVFHDDRWCAGVITRIQYGSKFSLKSDHWEGEKEFCVSQLRLRHEWIDGCWVQPSPEMSQHSQGKVTCKGNPMQAEVLNSETTLEGDTLGDDGYNIQLADREGSEPSDGGLLPQLGAVVKADPSPGLSAGQELLDMTKSTDTWLNENSVEDMQIVEAVTEKQNEDLNIPLRSYEAFNVANEETAVTPDVSPCSSPSHLSSSSVEHSRMWDVIEATEVFHAIPQQPDFYPILEYCSELRDGMAIGLMVTFDNQVANITKLQIPDPENMSEESLKMVSLLEAHGFDVQRVWDHLEKLPRIKHYQGQLDYKKTALSDLILKKQNDTQMLMNEIEMIDRYVEELHDRRSALVMQRESNEREISRLQIDEKMVTQASLSAEAEFASTRAEAW